MHIEQKQITLKPHGRGFHLITSEIIEKLPELNVFKKGIVNIFIKHTSCSLAINENADPTVRSDMELFFNMLLPENEIDYFEHTVEGPDDMTSHIKSVIIGNSVNIPVTNGTFNLGTWQGIFLCEHRNTPRSRNIVVTIIGEKK